MAGWAIVVLVLGMAPWAFGEEPEVLPPLEKIISPPSIGEQLRGPGELIDDTISRLITELEQANTSNALTQVLIGLDPGPLKKLSDKLEKEAMEPADARRLARIVEFAVTDYADGRSAVPMFRNSCGQLRPEVLSIAGNLGASAERVLPGLLAILEQQKSNHEDLNREKYGLSKSLKAKRERDAIMCSDQVAALEQAIGKIVRAMHYKKGERELATYLKEKITDRELRRLLLNAFTKYQDRLTYPEGSEGKQLKSQLASLKDVLWTVAGVDKREPIQFLPHYLPQIGNPFGLHNKYAPESRWDGHTPLQGPRIMPRELPPIDGGK